MYTLCQSVFIQNQTDVVLHCHSMHNQLMLYYIVLVSTDIAQCMSTYLPPPNQHISFISAIVGVPQWLMSMWFQVICVRLCQAHNSSTSPSEDTGLFTHDIISKIKIL